MVSSPLQGLVGAGLADMTRPAEKLSTSQSAVLTATGKMALNRFNSNTHNTTPVHLLLQLIEVICPVLKNSNIVPCAFYNL